MTTTSLVVMQSITHPKKMMMEQFLVSYSVKDCICRESNLNDIRLAKSRSNLYDGNYQKVSESTVTVEITNNTFEKYEFNNKQILPQKLFREIDMPVYDGKEYKTRIGYNGILINGVEILSYKSQDLCYYGDIKSIDVTGGGRKYDVIKSTPN